MNRITELFQRKSSQILNIYFTAGFPKLNDTLLILNSLQSSGADIVEIGMPYSDPVADGQTIQHSNQIALNNGMNVQLLFEQLATMRNTITVPVVLMGYLNPVLQFGVEHFCQKCQEIGIDGLILPDLPLPEYQEDYQAVFKKYGLLNTFLITPQTSEDRVRSIDLVSDGGFIYMVSSASTTGAKASISQQQEEYFDRIAAMNLRNPRLIGFGISDKETFQKACQTANGAIIGSAFINTIAQADHLPTAINEFVKNIIE